MLFTAKINELNSRIESNAATITELEARIEALREENNCIASRLQATLSAESACESAITQLTTALAMVNAVDSTMVETLQNAALAVFAADVPILAPEPEPAPETDGDDEIIEVVTNNPSENAQEDPSIEVQVITTYDGMKLAELRAECRKLNLPSTGNKSDLIARLEQYKGGSVSAENDLPMAA